MFKGKIFCLIIFVITQLSAIYAVANGSDFAIQPRIVDGNAADIHSARHQVSIRLRSDENKLFGSGFICGGSLISKDVVLTAAHCFLGDSADITFGNPKDYVVVMGNLNRYEHNENTLIYKILKLVVGKFNHYFDEDIALIFLEGSVPANHPTVKPIALNDGPLEKETMCQATGWGLTQNDKYSAPLKIIDLPYIDYDRCRQKTSYGNRLRNGMFCAGHLEGGGDVCDGDSGGPLVCHGIQAGIISWGKSCGEPLKPNIYTNVTYYKDWILKKVDEQNASRPKFAASVNLISGARLQSTKLLKRKT